ncbi:MAG: hypothetical protein H7257_09945 [Taibaiella sp.]|nr:hypothetical protein [Taibaiella sp.]
MLRKLSLLLLILSACLSASSARSAMKAVVRDAATKEALPFAAIRFGADGRGTIADLNGAFDLSGEDIFNIRWIEISVTGYEAKKVILPVQDSVIYMRRSIFSLQEVVVKPQYDKINRIMRAAINNKKHNNPDHYDWYRCHVYYKMTADANLPDSVFNDTAKDAKEWREFAASQHILMSETYSYRTWKKPQQLQEEIVGTRLSGFREPVFTGLITDVLPFHAYANYISLNGKDYHNPLSEGYDQFYRISLSNEILKGADTVWVLAFTPRDGNSATLKGSLFINSNGYAIASIIAAASDTVLNREIRIEQQYEFVQSGTGAYWFPRQLNYIIDLHLKSKKSTVTYHLKGTSHIDSVSFLEKKNFRFDKRHTVKQLKESGALSDSMWAQLRPDTLVAKERRTYTMLDSLGSELHFDRFMNFLSRLPEGKIPVSFIDVDLRRFVRANYYENFRLGLGGQTNEKLLKWVSLGAWAGYSFGDGNWRYGAFTEFYLDKNREFVVKAGYENDLSDPGRVQLHPELDKNYLKSYLLRRVDQVTGYSIAVHKKLGYLSLALTGRMQEIKPLYAYALQTEGRQYNTFSVNEAELNLRYAFAERTAPFFGRYYSTGTAYPVLYGSLKQGTIASSSYTAGYTQAIAAIAWHKHINRVGNEHILLEAGKVWSDKTLPVSKLFAANGFKNDKQSLYTFGGLMTVLPYEYYSDQFISLIARHDFDRKLYRLSLPHSGINSAPSPGLQYNMLYGKLQNPEAQTVIAFGVPDNAYHEAGILLNSIIRINYLNVYYITFNAGYFCHIADDLSFYKTGRVVYGAGIEF